MTPRKTPKHGHQTASQRIVAALGKYGDLTGREISDRAAVAYSSLNNGGYLRALLDADALHVTAWRPPAISGAWAPVYRLGPGESVPPPEATSNNQRTRNWYAKRGSERKKLMRIARRPIPVDPVTAALMGISKASPR